MNIYYQSVFAEGNGTDEQPAPRAPEPPTGPAQPPTQIRIQQPQPAPGEPSSAVDIYSYPQNLRDALQLITDAINRETEDSGDYDYLIAHAPTKRIKDQLERMRGEDAQNFKNLRRIYTSLTGQPPPEPSALARMPQRIKSFCDGLEKGLNVLEQESSEYPKILYALQNRTNINMMQDIIFTETRHYIQTNRMYFESLCANRTGSGPK